VYFEPNFNLQENGNMNVSFMLITIQALLLVPSRRYHLPSYSLHGTKLQYLVFLYPVSNESHIIFMHLNGVMKLGQPQTYMHTRCTSTRTHTHTHKHNHTHTHTHTLLWHDGSASNDIYNQMYRRSNNIIWNFCVSPFIRNIDATRPSITG